MNYITNIDVCDFSLAHVIIGNLLNNADKQGFVGKKLNVESRRLQGWNISLSAAALVRQSFSCGSSCADGQEPGVSVPLLRR